MQDGKFRVCCPRIVVKQDSSSSCSRNEVTNRRREIEAIIQKAGNKNDKQAEESRLRDLPEWLEEITDKFEDTQVPALANTSQDSDSDRRA